MKRRSGKSNWKVKGEFVGCNEKRAEKRRAKTAAAVGDVVIALRFKITHLNSEKKKLLMLNKDYHREIKDLKKQVAKLEKTVNLTWAREAGLRAKLKTEVKVKTERTE